MDDFLDDLLCLEDNPYFDAPTDITAETAFDDEIEEILVRKKKIKIDPLAIKTPIGIEYPDRNLLNPTSRTKILEDLKIPPLAHVTAPKIFIITLDGFISGVRFNEMQHMRILTPTTNIPIIKSNGGEMVHPGYYVPQHIKRTKRGRNKKIQPPKSCNSLKSQITFKVRRPEPHRSHEVIVHKLFRSGNIQISGLTYEDIDSCKLMVAEIISLIRDTCLVEDEPELTSLCSIMENYKFNIIIKPREAINLMQLKKELQRNVHLIDSINSTGEDVKLLYISYDYSLAAMRLVMICPSAPKKKKTLITNVFSTGKVNILGCCGAKYARVVCRYINLVMARSRDSVVIYNRDCDWSKYIVTLPTIVDDSVYYDPLKN
jgi:hypothetical protein